MDCGGSWCDGNVQYRLKSGSPVPRFTVLDVPRDSTNAYEPVYFDQGSSGTVISDAVLRGEQHTYILKARAGQQMTGRLDDSALAGNAILAVINWQTNGFLLEEEVGASSTIPNLGADSIVVGSIAGNVGYPLAVDIT